MYISIQRTAHGIIFGEEFILFTNELSTCSIVIWSNTLSC